MKHSPGTIVRLVHVRGPMEGQSHEFYGESISIGRDPTCHIRFPQDLVAVSRKHAEIKREGSRFKLIDLSKNGTFVNGKEIKETMIEHGDVLEFSSDGPKVSFLPLSKEKTSKAGIDPGAEKKEAGKISGRAARVPLVIQHGPYLHSFKELPVTIGRSLDCEFVVDLPDIQDRHAQLFFSRGQFWIKDLTGKKSVLIDNQPILFNAPLQPNARVALSPRGPVFRFLGKGRLCDIREALTERAADLSPGAGKSAQGDKPQRKRARKSILRKNRRE